MCKVNFAVNVKKITPNNIDNEICCIPFKQMINNVFFKKLPEVKYLTSRIISAYRLLQTGVIRKLIVTENSKEKILKETGCLNLHPERVHALWFQNNSFFDPRDSLQVKYEMLRFAMQEGMSKLKAAELFGVSRPTFYEAEAAFFEKGLVGLLPQQPGPKKAHKLNDNVMFFIEECINKNQKLQMQDLVKLIQDQFKISIHPRSVERAILRHKKKHNKRNRV